MIPNLTPLIYSYNRSPILEMCKFFWKKQCSTSTIVASNIYPENPDPQFIYPIPTADLGNNQHFRVLLMGALEQIDTKFVMLFLDDFMIRYVNWGKLDKLVHWLDYANIDSFSFIQQPLEHLTPVSNTMIAPKWDITNENMFIVSNGWKHRYSLHPSIWNRESLYALLVNSPHVDSSAFDNGYYITTPRPYITTASNISNFEYCQTLPFDINTCYISYIETVVRGQFMTNRGQFDNYFFHIEVNAMKQLFTEYGVVPDKESIFAEYVSDDMHKGLFY